MAFCLLSLVVFPSPSNIRSVKLERVEGSVKGACPNFLSLQQTIARLAQSVECSNSPGQGRFFSAAHQLPGGRKSCSIPDKSQFSPTSPP
uniref:Putative secreted protein n=1 Tax=Ixodes ricinus TaxID=34613 RepID=A0A6B0UGF0_IXORI